MKTSFFVAIVSSMLIVHSAFAADHVLTLKEALETGRIHQPLMTQAEGNAEAAHARSNTSRAGLLPQVGVTGRVGRSWNFSQVTNNAGFEASANQLLFDFGTTPNRWMAAKANEEAIKNSQIDTSRQVDLSIRTAFYKVVASKSLWLVAKANLENQLKHLQQVQALVEVGNRPAIDLAQAKTDEANARLQLINAETGFDTSKAQLNQAMGLESDIHYDVGNEDEPAVPGEESSLDGIIGQALTQRPDYAAVEAQVRAQELTVRALKGQFGPSLNLFGSAGYSGTNRNVPSPDFAFGVSLNWQLFQGLATLSQVKEAEANQMVIGAQRDAVRQRVRLEVEQALLSVKSNASGIVAAQEAVVNARERLRLAEARYQTGTGNIIELGDSQLAVTSAEATKVQAVYNLATARAQLLASLGR